MLIFTKRDYSDQKVFVRNLSFVALLYLPGMLCFTFNGEKLILLHAMLRI